MTTMLEVEVANPEVMAAPALQSVPSADSDIADDAAENAAAFALVEDDAEPLIVNGEPEGASIKFIRTGKSTKGRYLMAKVEIPPGSGPPLHAHTLTDEWFYAPDGGIVMLMGTRRYKDLDHTPDVVGRDTIRMVPMKKGSLVFAPRNHVHGFLNVTDKTVIVQLVWTPDTPGEESLLEYFKSIAKPILPSLKGALNNPIVQLKAVSEARAFGMMFSKDFWEYAEKVEDGIAPFGKNLPGLIKLLKSGEPAGPEA
ncbi:cupin domain-containing protein [Massilia antarctica]|uniref:Cupin domain-containing protein n=1 Tax=Massilia antarctica TaxID=2765360 RepID=A0AA48W9G9_9BURK|nr:cupin domain-containing protein [Massilia antarctica]QPI47429.1 cupin domain-containing protein [Massilia antarctica]